MNPVVTRWNVAQSNISEIQYLIHNSTIFAFKQSLALCTVNVYVVLFAVVLFSRVRSSWKFPLQFMYIYSRKNEDENRFVTFEMTCLRKILHVGIIRMDTVKNVTIRKQLNMQQTVINQICQKRLVRYFGRIERTCMSATRLPKIALEWRIRIPANIRKSENWVQSIARERSDQARGREATEGGRVCPPSHGRELLHFWTWNCAIWCIPTEEILT